MAVFEETCYVRRPPRQGQQFTFTNVVVLVKVIFKLSRSRNNVASNGKSESGHHYDIVLCIYVGDIIFLRRCCDTF